MIVLDSREPGSVIAKVQAYCKHNKIAVIPDEGMKPPALPVGDVLVVGKYMMFVVERKTSDDLYRSIVDGRWESQVSRLSRVHEDVSIEQMLAGKRRPVIHRVIIPLVLVYGWSPRHLETGKLGRVSGRPTGMLYASYMNAQLSAILSGVPVLFCGSLRYPEYLHGLLKYANKRRHKIVENVSINSFLDDEIVIDMEDDND